MAARVLQGGNSQIMTRTLQPGTIVVLCRAFAPLLPMSVATAQPDTLRICALHYFQKHPSIPMPEPAPRDTIEVSPHCGPLLNALFEHYEDSSPVMAAWLRTLWTHPATRVALRHRLAPAAFRRLETWSNMEIITLPAAMPHTQPALRPVANAGVTLLWPLLPGLFRQLGLLDEDRFIDRDVCRRAAHCMDHLAWADAKTDDDRLSLSKLLCGLPLLEPPLHCEPDDNSMGVIDNWLETVIGQLPAWSRLGNRAVRQMFLQRPGWLQSDLDATVLHVQPDMYDVLLSDWPWPINIAALPWLKEPLNIRWSVPPHAH
ncbi:contractile injection system tape measure protein [Pseudoxanthomonas sp. UTMC 1351]|uniref:contractile injection system tape measure protein n=1 Tax=Pseudoxanthomonas sp. UTMC 1351 TaxID=2695853 RepID=UPI0034CE980A